MVGLIDHRVLICACENLINGIQEASCMVMGKRKKGVKEAHFMPDRKAVDGDVKHP